jgi:hypothetical protein
MSINTNIKTEILCGGGIGRRTFYAVIEGWLQDTH